MKRKPSASLLISIALHIVLGAGLVWVLAIPVPFSAWLRNHHVESAPVQRIGFIAIPNHGTNTPGRSGGNGKPVTKERPAPPLVAPTTIPNGVSAPSGKGTPTGEAGSGPVIGAGGLRQGIAPSFDDPRVWLPPGTVLAAPRPEAQQLDSVLAVRIRAHLDSLQAIAANAGRKPGDWTFTKDGKKWGMDSKNIYIGDHAIPTAILALLPLNKLGNPILNAQDRQLALQRAEIMEGAQRAMNDEEFEEAVKRIRERKQREHDDEMKLRDQRRRQAEDSTIAQP